MNTLILGLLAHVDAGKTTLTEALLFKGGTIKKMGRVDRKDAFLDTEELEKKRGITIFSKQAVIHSKAGDIILMDTPGHIDFSSEMERTLGILDAALLIVSGPRGIESHTRTLWNLLHRHKIPVVIFVNKMDQEPSDREGVLASLKESFGDGCIDFTDYSLYLNENSDNNEDIGEKLDNFYEEIATCSEELLDEFLNCNMITKETVLQNIRSRIVFPVFFGSALRDKGVDELHRMVTCLLEGNNNSIRLDKTSSLSPRTGGMNPPSNRKKTTDDSFDQQFGASPFFDVPRGQVYKISHDPQGNRLTYIKLTGGTINIRDSITYSIRPQDQGTNSEQAPGDADDPDDTPMEITEKITGIRLYSGGDYESLQKAERGMVVALTGLSQTYAGQGLGGEEDIKPPTLIPALSYKMVLPKGCDPVTVLPMVRTLAQEDPQLNLNWNNDKKEITLGLMGEIQTQVIESLIEKRFGIKVGFSPGSIIYKETISQTAEGVGHFEPLRHYAEVHLLLEPGERGSGIQFENDCYPDTLPLNYQKLVMTHLKERQHRGILTGSVLTDVKITLKSGRSHLKHTEGGDFRQATYRAVRQGLMQVAHTLLEPYYQFTMTVPENYIGRAMTDLDNMKSSFAPAQITDGFALISGRGPVACLQSYGRDVTEYTGGLGRFELSVWGYDICHNSEAVIAERGYDPENDFRNPSYSVFCTHGAGFPVPWYEVFDYMDLPSVLYTEDALSGDDMLENPAVQREKERHYIRDEDRFIDREEVDRILNSASGANRGGGEGKRKGIAGKSRLNRRNLRDSGKDSLPAAETRIYKAPRSADGDRAGKKPEYLLVDGYNIIFAWPELKSLADDNVDGARGRLLDILSNYQGVRGCDIIVVFDAYRLKGHALEVIKYHNICVVYTKEAETADAYIEKFAHQNSSRYDITVATSDGLEQIIIRGAGAGLLSAADLKLEVERLSRETMENYNNRPENRKVFLGESFPDVKI